MLNLARSPFINRRPVQRAALLLWICGSVSLAINIGLYWRYRTGSGEKRTQRAEVERQIEAERQKISELSRKIQSLDLDGQNEQVAFLNQIISERTFHWSEFLDRLAEVLPRKVRLYSLAPQAVVEQVPRRRSSADASLPEDRRERVFLRVVGAAEDGQALLELVDALYAHPSFSLPRLTHESKEVPRGVRFDLNVSYLPQRAAESTEPPRAADTARAGPIAEAPTTEDTLGTSADRTSRQEGGAVSVPEIGAGVVGLREGSETSSVGSAGASKIVDAPPAPRSSAPTGQAVGAAVGVRGQNVAGRPAGPRPESLLLQPAASSAPRPQ